MFVDLYLIAICLFFWSWLLVIAGYYCYYCLSDNRQRPYTKVERAGGLSLCQSTGRDDQLLSGITHTVFIRIKAGLIYMQGLKYMPGSAAE